MNLEKRPWSPEDLAWAAGLFEGEGSIAIHKGRSRNLNVKLKMTDEDVVRHFHAIVGVGNVKGPYYAIGKKPVWIWQVGAFEDAQAVIAMLWKWLKVRRRSKACAVLVEFRSRQGRQTKSSRRLTAA